VRARAYKTAFQTAFKDAFTAVFGDRGARSRPTQPHRSVTVETGFPYPTVVTNPASPRQQAREAIRAGVRGLRGRGAALARSDHPEESGVRDKGGVHTGPEVNYHEWDNYVPYDQVLDHDKTSSGYTYYNPATQHLVGDHWGATAPSDRSLPPDSEENLRRLYGSEWRHTVPDVPYRYGKKWEDVPDHFTAVPADQVKAGVAPKDFVGTVEERDFHAANEGKLGDHLVGNEDRLVPAKWSTEEQAHGLYVGPVEDTVEMARQGDDHGLIGDRLWALPRGKTNSRLMWGQAEAYAGDKSMGFGDQLVPTREAIKQQWGAGEWKGQHTQHLADFLVSALPVNLDGQLRLHKAYGSEPFKVRPVGPAGDGKTED